MWQSILWWSKTDRNLVWIYISSIPITEFRFMNTIQLEVLMTFSLWSSGHFVECKESSSATSSYWKMLLLALSLVVPVYLVFAWLRIARLDGMECSLSNCVAGQGLTMALDEGQALFSKLKNNTLSKSA